MRTHPIENREPRTGIENHHQVTTKKKTPKEWVSVLLSDHLRYEDQIIPKIEQQFLGVLRLFPTLPNLKVLFQLFMKFQIDLKLHMDIEEKTVYPQILDVKASQIKNETHEVEHHEPYLSEICCALTRCEVATNPFVRMLIQQLENFDRELKQHAFIEENYLNR